MARIRLQSSHPLPKLRAWFLVPAEVINIHDLKLSLCSQLSMLKDVDLQPAQLVLEMDGFEVLEESPINLVREGDMVTYGYKQPFIFIVQVKLKRGSRRLKRREVAVPELHSRKRKSSSEENMLVEKPHKLSKKLKSSSSASTSSSDSSDSSDSESSSSSSSSSDSGISSSSDSAPLALPTKKKPSERMTVGIYTNSGKNVAENMRPKTQQSTVPPGFGKPSTQSRNQRRKIKRKFAAGQNQTPMETTTPAPAFYESESNGDDKSIVLPYDNPATETVLQPAPPTAVSRTPSASLGNRNKSKGFRKAMEGVIPQKVIFDSTTQHASPITPSSSTPAFIAPSERDVLPKNLFVTSVDVEWRTRQGQGQWQDVEEEPEQLVSEEVQVVQTLAAKPESGTFIDWTTVEKTWGKYEKIQAATTLSPDAIVAWKAFGLDPVTLTPQASLLHVGKVVTMDPVNLIVLPLVRPGIGHATFGRASVEQEIEDDDVELAEQISLPLAEVWSTDWRLVSKQ